MRNCSRRWSVIVALATLVASGLMMIAAPAQATSGGTLLAKGGGSLYSASPTIYQAAVPGGSARVWSVKIVNSSLTQQFKVAYTGSDFFVDVSVQQGGKTIGSPYYTPYIAPGGSLVLTLRVSVRAGAPQGTYPTILQIRDTETNAVIDSFTANTVSTDQVGATRHDLFLKYGSQPFVGGSVPQTLSSNVLKKGSSASFVLRLQNDGSVPAAIGLYGPTYGGCLPGPGATVKRGFTDVTSAVASGTFTTGVLDPGEKVDLKVTWTLHFPTSCTDSVFGFVASGADGSVTQTTHLPYAPA